MSQAEDDDDLPPKPKSKLAVIAPILAALVGGAAIGWLGATFLGGEAEAGDALASADEDAGAHGEAPAEGHGEPEGHGAPAEGHGEAPKEGHGEAPKGGHGEEAPKGGHGEAPKAGHGEAGGDASHAPVRADGRAVIGLGSFIVNLRGTGGGRVLRTEIQVEVPATKSGTVEERKAQLRDAVLVLISDYTYAELEGVDGKTRLRDELQARLTSLLGAPVIERLYFTEFVVQ